MKLISDKDIIGLWRNKKRTCLIRVICVIGIGSIDDFVVEAELVKGEISEEYDVFDSILPKRRNMWLRILSIPIFTTERFGRRFRFQCRCLIRVWKGTTVEMDGRALSKRDYPELYKTFGGA